MDNLDTLETQATSGDAGQAAASQANSQANGNEGQTLTGSGSAGGDLGAGAGAASAVGGQDPLAGAVPEWLKEKMGVGTYGELVDSIESARSTQQEQARLTEAYQELIRYYQAGQSQQGANAGAAAQGGGTQAGAQNNWFGYGSKDAYVAAFQMNPQEVRAREQIFNLQNRTDVRDAFKPLIEESIRPLKEQAYRASLEADYRALANRYPESSNPAIAGERGPVMQWVKSNPWVEQLKAQFPQVNLHEVAFKLGYFDVLYKQVQAANNQQKERQAAAGTARTNVGGAQVSKPVKTHEDAVDRAAEMLRAKGVSIPADFVSIAKRGINAGGIKTI